MSDIKIRKIKALTTSDVARLILDSDPWKELGFKRKDAAAMAAMGRTRAPKNGPQRIVLGAYSGRKLLGFAIITSGFIGGWYLNQLVISAESRGQGVGQRLMDESEAIVFAKSKNFYLCVSSFNKRGQAFYRRIGFKKVGTIAKLLVAKHDELLLRKTIGPLR